MGEPGADGTPGSRHMVHLRYMLSFLVNYAQSEPIYNSFILQVYYTNKFTALMLLKMLVQICITGAF